MKRDLKFVRDLIGETKQKRDALVEKQENGTVLTAEEIAQFDTYQSDLEGLLGEEKRLLVLNESRSQSPVTGLTGNRDFSAKDEKDLSSFSLLRGLATLAQGKALTGVEKEVNDIAHEEARSKGIILEGFGVPAFHSLFPFLPIVSVIFFLTPTNAFMSYLSFTIFTRTKDFNSPVE